MTHGRIVLAVLALTTVGLLPHCATAQQAPVVENVAGQPRLAVTKHSGRYGGETIRYTATVREHYLRNEAGAATAAVTTIAYVRDGVKDASKRPVLFLFNGGPGASSSPLHMSAMGPMRRRSSTSPEADFAPNPFSPIDAMDLVFIDPTGTGFSRPLPGMDPKPYYTVNGDALAVKSVIAEWLKMNGREGSPRFLVGESYGTTRAAVIIKNSKDLPFNGVMLVAVAPDLSGREMPFVASLPTMAAGAWYHQKIDRAGRTVQQHYDAALDFARTDYVTALIQGASLPAADKRRVAERMSALIGLPADLIVQENLRVSKNTWMFNLLKDRELRTGLLDVRVTAKLEPGADGAIDDPALGVVPPRAPGAAQSGPPTAAAVGPVESPAVGAYLKNVLKYPSNDPYYGVNFSVNVAWNRQGAGSAFEGIAEAMKADPKLRLFWSGGVYDLTTPAYGAAYTFDQIGVPSDRVTAEIFPGPHGVYDGDDNLERFNKAVRDFVLK